MQVIDNVRTFIDQRDRLPMIDVRSPAEFQRGHIPNAKSVPLFDDDERAKIGICYKHSGREAAIALGFSIAGPKSEKLVDAVKRVAPTPELLLHCWRGGLRSEAFAWLLQKCNYRPFVLAGGYKAFRREVRRSFAEQRRVVILGGLSGTGKTQLLRAMREAGEQVLDLEDLARHRGSVFGGLPQPQPTVEQFENDLFDQWRSFDSERMVWVEDESRTVGRVVIPDEIWQQMQDAPAILVEAARERRLNFLLQEYRHTTLEEFAEGTTKLRKRLGPQRCQQILQAFEGEKLDVAADLLLEYYDKAYATAREKYPHKAVSRYQLRRPADTGSIPGLIQLADQLTSPMIPHGELS